MAEPDELRVTEVHRALAHAIQSGPDGEDWLAALREADRIIEAVRDDYDTELTLKGWPVHLAERARLAEQRLDTADRTIIDLMAQRDALETTVRLNAHEVVSLRGEIDVLLAEAKRLMKPLDFISVARCLHEHQHDAETDAKTGAQMISEERDRQIERWGWQHDKNHVHGELMDAAGVYLDVAMTARVRENAAQLLAVHRLWPWEEATYEPSDNPIRNLEKAGALIAAEIDRIQRADSGPADACPGTGSA